MKNGQYLNFNKLPLQTEFTIDGIELSLVVPAYNEEARLPLMIDQVVNYFNGKLKYEIIIVNDGSKDNTWKVIENLSKKYPNVDISGITYKKNAGKGYAVTTGMKFTRGANILMVDADGATDISDYEKLNNIINPLNSDSKNGALVIGSRNLLVEEVVAQRAWYRNILMHINNFIVRQIIGLSNIKDTQCGFKLFSRKAAKNIFFNLHLVRWAFDVEMLYIAKNYQIPTIEIPVSFKEVEGSKLNVVTASISFLRDYAAMIVFYNTGYWTLPELSDYKLIYN